MSIGSDPRIQAIIDSYRAGEYNPYYQQNTYEVTPGQFYNPIYDLRTEQIAAGELAPGSQFPNSQVPVDTTTTETPKETFDPCPPGYQLIDGVCQPDTMFQSNKKKNRQPTPVEISKEGLVKGFKQVIPPGLGLDSGAANSMAMLELEKKYGHDLAQQMAEMNQKYRYRGVQYNPETGQIAAMSPKNFGELVGDMGGAVGSMFGGFTDALQNYIGSGGLLGSAINLFKPKEQPIVTTGGSSNINVREFGPTVDMRQPTVGTLNPIDKIIAAQELLDELNQAEKNKNKPTYTIPKKGTGSTGSPGRNYTISPTPKKGTGSSGPPGRNYSTSAMNRAAQAASRLGTTLATRGK